MSGHFIRIGSKAATGEAYRHRLLDQVIEPLKTRAEIRHLLETTSVFVGTIASFQGKSELFQFVDFDVLIMDEASQVLEPSMVGLLSRFKKTILIGDHMQLPAISVQTPKTGLVSQDQAWPKKIGLTDMRMSYFERMFRLYQANGWEQGLGILHEQGRMHASIQQFANTYVYHGILKTVHHEDQMAPLSRFVGESGRGLFSSHLIYIATGSSWKETYSRTNLEEAHVVLRVLKLWQERIRQYHLTWSIGIITPFRAQIAAIQHEAHLQGVDIAEITVDTVERFQGGARDVMIMSCSVNTSSMLARITSVNSEGVDRKLNVAVTRARRQFVLIGDENILRTEPAYAGLISMSTRWTPDADEDAIA